MVLGNIVVLGVCSTSVVTRVFPLVDAIEVTLGEAAVVGRGVNAAVSSKPGVVDTDEVAVEPNNASVVPTKTSFALSGSTAAGGKPNIMR